MLLFCFIFIYVNYNGTAEVATYLQFGIPLRISEILNSKVGLDTCYTKSRFSHFLQLLQVKAKI